MELDRRYYINDGLHNWWYPAIRETLDFSKRATLTLNSNAYVTKGDSPSGSLYHTDWVVGVRNATGWLSSPAVSLGQHRTYMAWVWQRDDANHQFSQTLAQNVSSTAALSKDIVGLTWVHNDRDAIRVVCGNGTTGTNGTAANVNLGQWTHVAGVITPTAMRLFIDGVLATSDSHSTPAYATSRQHFSNEGSTNRNCNYDDLRIYDVALPDAAISAIYYQSKKRYPNVFRRRTFRGFSPATATAAITGTATASITEDDVVTGSKTIIITLTGDTFKAADTGPIGTTAQSQALLNNIDSAQAEATGWDAEVKANLVPATHLVRTSDTVATVTLPAAASYDITAQETITVTVPTDVLVLGAGAITGSPTFTVDTVASGIPYLLEGGMFAGGFQTMGGGL